MRKTTIFILLLLTLVARADFHDLSLSVTVKIQTNGSAEVTELIKLGVDPGSTDLYNRSIYARELTIMDWQQTTKSEYLRQHIISSSPARNMRITPQDLETYSFVTQSTAIIKLEYEVDGVVMVNHTGPRTITYTLNKAALSFQPSPSGPVLPRNNELTIIIPPDAVVTSLYPDPTEPEVKRNYLNQVLGVSNFTWKGTVPLMEFTLVFTREEPIDVEVRRFFEEVAASFIAFSLSLPGAVVLLLLLAFVVLMAMRKR
ncbi:MAG: hypothetical protein QXF56_02920 [Candidatus Micrarchaeia archaeon]